MPGETAPEEVNITTAALAGKTAGGVGLGREWGGGVMHECGKWEEKERGR